MTDAPDTDVERLAEYRWLFAHAAFLGRERTAEEIRFRFRAEPGIEEWVRDLAAREKACCAFFAFDVTTEGDEVRYDAAVTDNDLARAILEEYYALPDLLVESVDELRERLVGRGVEFVSDAAGTVHQVQPVASGRIEA
ncbi:hypothetical protein [Amycolatopsis sp. lyj-346]|uniref:hypothetical protein n=1 Tax=Amycolatopsis sp. lyj-346 TaxID=2789289 RepID=UPI00397D2752